MTTLSQFVPSVTASNRRPDNSRLARFLIEMHADAIQCDRNELLEGLEANRALLNVSTYYHLGKSILTDTRDEVRCVFRIEMQRLVEEPETLAPWQPGYLLEKMGAGERIDRAGNLWPFEEGA